jgi:hypothetical protein
LRVYNTTSCNTQSSAPEDGRDHRPKHVELIGIINKPLLLHLVGVYIIYINDARSNKYQICGLEAAFFCIEDLFLLSKAELNEILLPT